LLVTAPQHDQEIVCVSYNGVALCGDYQGLEEPEWIWFADDTSLPTCGGSFDLAVVAGVPRNGGLFSGPFEDLSLGERLLVEKKRSEMEHSMATFGGDEKLHVNTRDPAPPASGELILHHVLPPRYRDPVVGDLAEIYRNAVASFGVRRANRIYWCQLVGAVVRLVPQKVWLAIAGVAAWVLGKG
jgi:hypothetical protein